MSPAQFAKLYRTAVQALKKEHDKLTTTAERLIELHGQFSQKLAEARNEILEEFNRIADQELSGEVPTEWKTLEGTIEEATLPDTYDVESAFSLEDALDIKTLEGKLLDLTQALQTTPPKVTITFNEGEDDEEDVLVKLPGT